MLTQIVPDVPSDVFAIQRCIFHSIIGCLDFALAGALVFLLLVLTALVVVFGATVFCDFFALAVGVVDFTTVFFLAAVFDEFGFPVWALTVEVFVFVVVLLVLGMRVSVILI